MISVIHALQWGFQKLCPQTNYEEGRSDAQAQDEYHLKLSNIARCNAAEVYSTEMLPYLCDVETIKFLRDANVLFIVKQQLPNPEDSDPSKMTELLLRTYPHAHVHPVLNQQPRHIPEGNASDRNKECGNISKKMDIIEQATIMSSQICPLLRTQFAQCHVIAVDPLVAWQQDMEDNSLLDDHPRLTQDQLEIHHSENYSFRPRYYGWFLNKNAAEMLVEKAKEVLNVLSDVMSPQDSTHNLPDILKWHEGHKYYVYSNLDTFHCTATYLGRDKRNPYHTKSHVIKSVGRKFTLCVTGFFYSYKAIFAVVDLNNSSHPELMLSLFKKAEEEAEFSTDGGEGNTAAKEQDRLKALTKDEVQENLEGNALEEKRAVQGLYHGRSAHITIAYHQGGQAKVSGEELLFIRAKNLEAEVKWETVLGQALRFDSDRYLVTLKQPLMIDCLFHGYIV